MKARERLLKHELNHVTSSNHTVVLHFNYNKSEVVTMFHKNLQVLAPLLLLWLHLYFPFPNLPRHTGLLAVQAPSLPYGLCSKLFSLWCSVMLSSFKYFLATSSLSLNFVINFICSMTTILILYPPKFLLHSFQIFSSFSLGFSLIFSIALTTL